MLLHSISKDKWFHEIHVLMCYLVSCSFLLSQAGKHMWRQHIIFPLFPFFHSLILPFSHYFPSLICSCFVYHRLTEPSGPSHNMVLFPLFQSPAWSYEFSFYGHMDFDTHFLQKYSGPHPFLTEMWCSPCCIIPSLHSFPHCRTLPILIYTDNFGFFTDILIDFYLLTQWRREHQFFVRNLGTQMTPESKLMHIRSMFGVGVREIKSPCPRDNEKW